MSRNEHLPLTETMYYILLALLEPAHGYLVMQRVETLSGGQVKMAAGTLYGAIDNLLKLKWIEPVESTDSRRKVYATTAAGLQMLKLDFERMCHMIETTKRVLQEDQLW